MSVSITQSAIDTEQILNKTHNRSAGAILLFVGTTREITGDRITRWLDYQCYQPMALSKLSELEEQAHQQWDITAIEIVHRIGKLMPGETSVAIAVSAPHRADTFACGQWLIDTLKQEVPIWKQEQWADGQPQWVHPEMEQPQPDES